MVVRDGNVAAGEILNLAGIGKTFAVGFRRRKVRVLSDISLSLGRGEIFALLGPNGAGKTTLMKVILGLVRPTHGEGTLLGRPLGDLHARRRVGFQPEQPYLYPALTSAETLELMAGISRIPRDRRRPRMAAVIEQCGLGPHLRTPVAKLSRGWLQRLTLAGALLPDPEFLLLDEPLGGLDPEARLAVKHLIRALRDQGKTILINSHILPDIEMLADRVALLRQGRLIACGRIAELLSQESEGVEIEVQFERPLPRPAGCELLSERPESGTALWFVPGDDPPALRGVLMEILGAGASVRSLAPRRVALEAFFAQAMKQDTATPQCPDGMRVAA
jgi:ABC-2 type transport system ATP-binding protein